MSTNTSMALIHLDQRAHELQMQLIRGLLSDPAAGRTLNQVYSHVGDYVGTKVNRAAYRWGRGPSATADRIATFFGTGSQREANLDTLCVDGCPRLEEECSRLLKYALPYETAQTQVATFKCIVTIATRYHGTRRLFLKSKYLSRARNMEALISAVWARADDTAQPYEWDYYCQLAAVCLSEQHISPILGNISPRCLGSIDTKSGDLSVIERLLVASESSATSISDALARRYLAGVLELPAFWQESGAIHIAVFTKILDHIICVLNDLGVDSDEDSDEDKNGIIFDQEGIDSMASAILIGVLDLHTEDPKSQYWYRNLSEIVRPRAERLLPASAALATGPDMKNIIPDTTPVTLDILTRADANEISEMHTDHISIRSIGDLVNDSVQDVGSVAPRVVYTEAATPLRSATLGSSLRRWSSGLYKLGNGHKKNVPTSSTKRPKRILGWLRALLSRNTSHEFVASSETPTEDISTRGNSISEPAPGSSVECDEDEAGGEDSESQAGSDRTSIQTSSANDSENEHPSMNQITSSAVLSNGTTRDALNGSLESRDIVPEGTSTIPLNIPAAQRSPDMLLNETSDVTVAAEAEPYSQQMAHSDGIFIQTSSANDSEDEHSFIREHPPALPPNNMTNEALISSTGTSRDYHPGRNYVNNFQASKPFLSWVESAVGPAHEMMWTVQCKVSGEVKGTGVAHSKADAKEEAARQALVALGVSK
ncbi:hypothetical protein B0H13DRAFT_2420074 [Mycena leptocephala]|nr:hypothetical protein B0H13DRAFT_2420074 [Mycena leptocephala]